MGRLLLAIAALALLAGCQEADPAVSTGSPVLVRALAVQPVASAPAADAPATSTLSVAYTLSNRGTAAAHATAGSTLFVHAVVRNEAGVCVAQLDPPATQVMTAFTVPAGRQLGCVLEWPVPAGLCDEMLTVELTDVFDPALVTTTSIVVAAPRPAGTG